MPSNPECEDYHGPGDCVTSGYSGGMVCPPCQEFYNLPRVSLADVWVGVDDGRVTLTNPDGTSAAPSDPNQGSAA